MTPQSLPNMTGSARPGQPAQSGVRAESLRATNLSLVLRTVLANPGTVSRAAVSAHTGITRATVSRLVDELISAGILVELGTSGEALRGRPAVLLAPRPGGAVALGLEVNISSLSARAVDLSGTVLAEEVLIGDFAGSDPNATMEQLGHVARRVMSVGRPTGAPYVGAGLALPGLVSTHALTLAPNLGWRDIPLPELLSPIEDLSVSIVGNEADFAAFAEATPRPGVLAGPPSFIYVSGEVGVGAGIIIDHQPLVGAHGWSGEIGHVVTDPNGPICSCGATGCLEAYLGRRALARLAGLPPESAVTEVVAAANSGNEQAVSAIAQGGVALGRALSTVINTVDIPVVLLGGNVADIAGALIPYARPELETRVLQAPWTTIDIQVAEHTERIAATGAAHRVMQTLVDNPMVWTA